MPVSYPKKCWLSTIMDSTRAAAVGEAPRADRSEGGKRILQRRSASRCSHGDLPRALVRRRSLAAGGRAGLLSVEQLPQLRRQAGDVHLRLAARIGSPPLLRVSHGFRRELAKIGSVALLVLAG